MLSAYELQTTDKKVIMTISAEDDVKFEDIDVRRALTLDFMYLVICFCT